MATARAIRRGGSEREAPGEENSSDAEVPGKAEPVRSLRAVPAPGRPGPRQAGEPERADAGADGVAEDIVGPPIEAPEEAVDARFVFASDASPISDATPAADAETVALTPAHALEVLGHALGPAFDAEYVLGKTRMRDLLCARLGASELEAEEMVDDLERSGALPFTDSPGGGTFRIEPPESLFLPPDSSSA